MPVNILSIESSCDDTSAALLQDGRVLANLTASQRIHEQFGGVVPELASRAHMKHILPVVDQALERAKLSKKDLDAIAFTRGPGLIGSLIVGVNFAKAMAVGLNIPIIEVNHMQAHVAAHYIDYPKPTFPFLCLTVSGGHTQIVLVKDYLEMEVIGETKDDAAGEAFDKAAKLFGMPYPGGPLVDKYAKEGEPIFQFNKPKVDGLDFSFSGLKTAILYFIQKQQKQNPNFTEENLNNLCASIQTTIVDILIEKINRAAKDYKIDQFAIAGGVSANSHLRSEFEQLCQRNKWKAFIPQFQYCTDNAAMIGIVAHYKYLQNQFAQQTIGPVARYSLQ